MEKRTVTLLLRAIAYLHMVSILLRQLREELVGLASEITALLDLLV